MKIDVYSHCFVVSDLNERQLKAVTTFAEFFVEYEITFENGRREKLAKRAFAVGNVHKRVYRFHINAKGLFFKTMGIEQIPVSEMRICKHEFELDDSFKVTFRPTDNLHTPRDDQPDIINKILADGSNKVVTAQPGFGKTLVTFHVMNQLQLRTAAFMKSSYLERWEPDLEKTFDIRKKELLIVRGGGPLRNLMEMALDGDTIGNMNIISINTFSKYINEFEANGHRSGYPIAPIEFFQKMKIGLGVLDEAHQNPHQIMRMFCHMHAHKFLSLTGTPNSSNSFINAVMRMMFPVAERICPEFYKPIVNVTGIKYSASNPRALRYKGRGGAYSHLVFEQNLMTSKNRKLLEIYFNMIHFYVEREYILVREEGQKAIVFCATVKLCTALMKWFQRKYPNLKIVKYTADDDMVVMDTADIIFSTVLSAGTAVDIKGLRYNLMTTVVDSQQSNEQTLGRTRPLSGWPHIDPVFHYFICLAIEKTVKYHNNKLEFFAGKVKSHGVEYAPFSL